MNINPKILSIPPYISTSWKNIASLHVDTQNPTLVLIVTLLNGTCIEVPQLAPDTIEMIFRAHAHFLELEEKAVPTKAPPRTPHNHPAGSEQIVSFELPFNNGLAELEGFGTLLEHNPALADSPNLPEDVLEKITQLSQTMPIHDPDAIPKPEPHCNCVRCQIARAMQAGVKEKEDIIELPEEIVSDEELKFRIWDIAQTGEKLYQISNPLDNNEHYTVFLGDPIGCTCGEKQCEHVKAVLNT